LRKSWGALALILGGTMLIAGCQDEPGGGAACPALCPEQGLTFKDTVLDAVLDTDVSVTGFPVLGTEPTLLAANSFVGTDTLRTVAVVRFDTLRNTFAASASGAVGRPFTTVDSAMVHVDFSAFSAGLDTVFVRSDSVTFEVYNVDTTASIFEPEAIAALIRPDRLIPGAARTVARDSITGTLSIPLPDTLVRRAVLGGTSIALGFAVRSPKDSSVQVRFISSEGGSTSSLTYAGRDDTSSTLVGQEENGRAGGTDLPQLADYTVVVKGSVPPDSTLLAVGGLPASRAFLRFDLPPTIVDSTTVVRATLLLTQQPDARFLSSDSLTVVPLLVQASTSVTDPGKASTLAAPAGFINLQPVTLLPQDSGPRTFELVPLIRFWKAAASLDTQHALVLQIQNEGVDPRQVFFLSTNAAVADSLRPRLRLSYIPRASFGLP
jgi:hypothetical protein